MLIPLRQLRPLLSTRDGLARLIELHAEEADYVDFKETINHRDPAEKHEIRADCAALASAGEGFLVVGISETGDGRNEAKELVGLPKAHALDLKKCIEDCLGSAIDPPIITGQRTVRLVDLDVDRAALVVELRGRHGLPRAVETRDGGVKFVVRQAGKKRWLTPAEARAITRELDLWRPLKRAVAVIFVAGLVLGGAVYATFAEQRRRLVAQDEAIAVQQRRITNQDQKLSDQEHKLADQARKIADQERKLTPRAINGRNVPGEVVMKIRARPVKPISVVATSQAPETVAFAIELYQGLPQLGLPVTGSCPGQDIHMVTGACAGVQIQSTENSPDDPLRVLADWLRGEGFEVTFRANLGANTIFVSPRSTE